jgi:F-box domain
MSDETVEDDNISNLPIEILVNIAVDLPLEDVQALCATSAKLNRLCKDKYLWQNRLNESFPVYANTIPEEMSPYEYYVALDKVWNLTDNKGEYLVTDVPQLSLYQNRSIMLLYPVPPFARDSRGSILPDIEISDINQPMVLVGYYPRKVAPMVPLPRRALDRKITVISNSEDRMRYALAARELQDRGYTEVYIMTGAELSEYLGNATDLGYLSLSVSALVTEIDEDLFEMK